MKRCIKEEIVVEEVKHKGSAVKKVKHIILAIIIIFNCLILSGLLIVFVLIHKDSGRKEEVKIVEQNEYQTKAGKGTKYEIIDGKLYGWGWNDWGQLGQGTVEDISVIHEEPMLIADSVVHVDTCNNGTTVFLNDKGQLYGIGNNVSGQLGVPIDATERYNRKERFVTVPTLITEHVKYAVVGSDYIVILKQDGNLYVMGDDNKGQLGDGPVESNVEGHYIYGYTPFSTEPQYIMGGISYIACGGCTIAAVKDNGELWMWGDNTYGQVGNTIVGPKGSSTTNFSVTKPYLTMQKVKNVRFEGEFDTTVYAETLSGGTYVWGEGYSAVPTKIEVEEKEEEEIGYLQNPIPGKPCDNPSEAGWDMEHIVDVRENFSWMSYIPEEGTEDDTYLLGKTKSYTLYGKGDYSYLLLECGGEYAQIRYDYASNYMTPLELMEIDIDKDEKTELAIKFNVKHGTGLSIDTFLLADFGTDSKLYVHQYLDEDFNIDLGEALSFEKKEHGLQAKVNGKNAGYFMQNMEDMGAFHMATVGSQMHFYYDQIENEIQLSGDIMFMVEDSVSYWINWNDVTATVCWNGEEFSLSDFTSRNRDMEERIIEALEEDYGVENLYDVNLYYDASAMNQEIISVTAEILKTKSDRVYDRKEIYLKRDCEGVEVYGGWEINE